MDTQLSFPSFDGDFMELNGFIQKLVEEYNKGEINSWEDLDERVNSFYTPERMNTIEAKAPGWKKMASFSDGVTLSHVTCVFLGMFMLPEFQALSMEQKQIAKWIVLFHDIDKVHVAGKKDPMHAFRSGVVTANVLPKLGFRVEKGYAELIRSWSEFTVNASTMEAGNPSPKPDNSKLPKILSDIEQLFGRDTPGTLIVKTVLLHISLNIDIHYPTPSPMTETEIQSLIDPTLFPLLKVMMFSDTEGWSLFEPEVRVQRMRDALESFERVEKLIA